MTRDPFNPLPQKPPSDLLPHEQHNLLESLPLEAIPGAPHLASTEAPRQPEPLAGTMARPLSVSRANAILARLLAIALPPTFFVQGEISNFRTYDRGHAFFTLKDANAEIPCILWRDDLARLKFRPNNGISVIAKGAVRLYESQGKLQLYVDTLFPQGAGALELAFRQLCEKLRAEGLFEQSRKRPIPKLPRRIAIITSKTGDVLHDVLTTAWRRFPGLHVLLCPTRVQGEQATPDIIQAIKNIHTYNQQLANDSQSKIKTQKSKIENNSVHSVPSPIDLILLVRGGGSLEDLWAFNEEPLARAIINSRIPIATGIGHEPDTTIADLVGDLRGPTPTGITELTIPDTRTLLTHLANKSALLTRDLRRTTSLATHTLERTTTRFHTAITESLRNRELRIELLCKQIERIEPKHAIAQSWRRAEDAQRRLTQATRTKLQRHTQTVTSLNQRLERLSPKPTLTRHRDRLTHLQTRLKNALQTRLTHCTQKLTHTQSQLQLVSPQNTLNRGYSITTAKDGTIIRNANQVKKGDQLQTRLAEGQITSTVGKPKQESLF